MEEVTEALETLISAIETLDNKVAYLDTQVKALSAIEAIEQVELQTSRIANAKALIDSGLGIQDALKIAGIDYTVMQSSTYDAELLDVLKSIVES